MIASPAGWEERELGELLEFFDHKRVPLSGRERASRQGTYPYYGASGIIDHIDDYMFDGTYLLIAEDGENLNSRKTPVAFFASGKFWVNNHAHVVKAIAGVADDYFVKAWFDQANISGYITGAAQPKLSQANLRRIRLKVPPLPNQRKIADILSAYDDLIENNTRRIKILEEMAQTIYREWFVHFCFPGHEQVEMVETELGLAPEGWESNRLSDISILHRDGVVPSAHGNELFHHYSIPAFDADREPVAEYGHTIRSNKYLVHPESVLLSKLNPRIPRVWLPFLANTHRSIASTEFLVLTVGPELNRYFLYGLCNSPEFFERFSSMALGTSTSHQRVKPEDLLDMVLLLPTPQTLEDYATIVEPMLILSDALRRRNANLRQTRDLLLPKLVSGEVEITSSELDGGALP